MATQLRRGAHQSGAFTIQEMKEKTYLFVCHANQRRSRAAEELCSRLAAARGLPISVLSAGMSQQADTSVTQSLADQADTIFVMEEHMREELQHSYPQPVGKIVCLDIPDEYERDSVVLMKLLRDALEPYLSE